MSICYTFIDNQNINIKYKHDWSHGSVWFCVVGYWDDKISPWQCYWIPCQLVPLINFECESKCLNWLTLLRKLIWNSLYFFFLTGLLTFVWPFSIYIFLAWESGDWSVTGPGYAHLEIPTPTKRVSSVSEKERQGIKYHNIKRCRWVLKSKSWGVSILIWCNPPSLSLAEKIPLLCCDWTA